MSDAASQTEPVTCNTGSGELLSIDRMDAGVLSLDAAIAKLESDEDITSLKVDLGGDVIVQVSFDDGLLQRLVGHRRFAGVASGVADISSGTQIANDETIWVATEIRDILAALGSG